MTICGGRTNAQTYIGRLIEVSKKKFALLEQMLQSYLLQEEDLNADHSQDDAQAANRQQELVDRRQALMDAVDKLDEEFHVYTERLKHTLGIETLDELSRFSVEGRQELKEVVGRISGLLEELSDRHHKTSQHLEEKVRSAGEKNILIGRTKHASQAYQPGKTQQSSSVYFDRKK